MYKNINITAYDNSNAIDSYVFNLTINNLNDAPIINTTNPPTSINQNDTFYYDFNASDIDIPYGDILRFTITGGTYEGNSPINTSIVDITYWATFNTATGELSGVANNSLVGMYQNINITVYDTSNASNSFMFNLTINNLNDAPVINNKLSTLTLNSIDTLDHDFNVTDIDIPYGDSISSVYSFIKTTPIFVVNVLSNKKAFSMVDDTNAVSTYGDTSYGANSNSTITSDVNASTLVATNRAFAVIKNNGSVFVWGDPGYGGDNNDVANLNNIVKLYANTKAFLALMSNGSVFVWGDPQSARQSAISYIHDAKQVYSLNSPESEAGAFAIVYGANSDLIMATGNGRVAINRENVGETANIHATQGAFAVLKKNEYIYSWGDSNFGGIGNYIAQNTTQIVANDRAFAALLKTGSFIMWGDETYGGSGANWASFNGATNIQKLYSNHGAFVAVNNLGEAFVWGSTEYGAYTQSVAGNIHLESVTNWGSNVIVSDIIAGNSSFGAITSNGSFFIIRSTNPNYAIRSTNGVRMANVTEAYAQGEIYNIFVDTPQGKAWWRNTAGSTSFTDTGYVVDDNAKVFTNDYATVVVKSDGTILALGDNRYGASIRNTKVATTTNTYGANSAKDTAFAFNQSTYHLTKLSNDQDWGNYTFVLNVTDTQGLSDVFRLKINVTQPLPFILSSIGYANNSVFPVNFTCDGGWQSPPYSWANPPSDTASYALIMDDINCTTRACVHWGLYNIPLTKTSLILDEKNTIGNTQGINQGQAYTGVNEYAPPCPPIGASPHIYTTTIYALDASMPTITNNPTFNRAEFVLQYGAHILSSSSLVSRYAYGLTP